MVPAAVVDATIAELLPLLGSRTTSSIDGGNSHYIDDIRRAKALEPRGIHYVDVGTSGGVWGLERGYCLMIGGDDAAVARLEPIFATLAPGASDGRRARRARRAAAAAERATCTAARRRRPLREDGPQRHRVRNDGRVRRRLQHPRARQRRRGARTTVDAETAPLRHPEHYQYDSAAGRSPRCGGAAASIAIVAARSDRRGARRTIPISRASPAASRIPAKGAGPRRRRSTRPRRRRC